MKKLILCADDYALNAAVDAGIVQLVEMGRLSAVGCMTESSRWLETGNRLPALRDRIDIGLHFNLTQYFPASVDAGAAKRPLGQTLRSALLGRIDTGAVVDSLHFQLDRFEAVMGDAPDFVDGHQHVHIFPHIRKAVLGALARRYRLRRPWLRQINPDLRGSADLHKRALLALLNRRFEHTAHHLGFTCNRRFAGIYSLRPDAGFPQLMEQWLRTCGDGTLLMCHPGLARDDGGPDDDIAATRPIEWSWLAGAAFAEQLERQQIQLVRFRDLQ